jgi:hypothetical protein
MADSLSLAFLVLLESLSPEQRAAFLLREVFDEPYDRIAGWSPCGEANRAGGRVAAPLLEPPDDGVEMLSVAVGEQHGELGTTHARQHSRSAERSCDRHQKTAASRTFGLEAEGEGFEPSVQGLPTQRFSRPRRHGRNAASQLESGFRGNTGGNESRPRRFLRSIGSGARQCCSHWKEACARGWDATLSACRDCRTHARSPKARTVTLANSGHHVGLDAADGLLAILRETTTATAASPR